MARAIVGCLAPQIDRAEVARIRTPPPEDLTAHGLALRGWSVISRPEMAYDSEPRDRAADLARQALALDPRSGLASPGGRFITPRPAPSERRFPKGSTSRPGPSALIRQIITLGGCEVLCNS